MNAKGRQRVDYPAVVSRAATDGYANGGPSFSQYIDKRWDVFANMSPLAEKNRNDQ